MNESANIETEMKLSWYLGIWKLKTWTELFISEKFYRVKFFIELDISTLILTGI